MITLRPRGQQRTDPRPVRCDPNKTECFTCLWGKSQFAWNIMTIGGNFDKSYEKMSCKISPAIRLWHKYHLPVRFITMGYTWSFTTGWIWPFLQNEQRKGLCEATYLCVKWGRFFDITILSVLICCYQYSLHFSTAKSLRLCDAYICVSKHGLRWFK